MSQQTWSDHPDVQEFFDWLEKNDSRGLIDPASKEPSFFVAQAVLKTYFHDRGCSNLRKLLMVVFPGQELPVDAAEIAKHYSGVFCILLLIGKPRYIQSFVQSDKLQDSCLPFNPASKPGGFPTDPNEKDANGFLLRFCERQMMFCAPILDYHTTRKFDEDRILPIILAEPLATGGSANLYKIVLDKSYNHLRSEDGSLPPGDIYANLFVLKTYSGHDAQRYFKNEVNGFKRLRNPRTSSMIGFYGSFIQGNRYNIILEYADRGSLRQYFKNTPPPTSGEDILRFWESLFALLEALQRIHMGHESTQLDPSQPLQGWHQDVKPENILVTSESETIKSPYAWHFKLGDLGISHFKGLSTSPEDNTDQDSQGTRTYGAPECCRIGRILQRTKLNVRNNVDVWSLGAIFSEAAVWVVNGYEGLKEYRRARRSAVKLVPGLTDSDCFHDGENMLQLVHATHKSLRAGLRRYDFITESAANMAEDMLLDANSRPNTITFLKKAGKILEEAKSTLSEDMPSTPKKSKTSARQSGSSHSSQSSSSTSAVLDTGQSSPSSPMGINTGTQSPSNYKASQVQHSEIFGGSRVGYRPPRSESIWRGQSQAESQHGQLPYPPGQGMSRVSSGFSELSRVDSHHENDPHHSAQGLSAIPNGFPHPNFIPQTPPRSNTQQTHHSGQRLPPNTGSFPLHHSGRSINREQDGRMTGRSQVVSMPLPTTSALLDEESFYTHYGHGTQGQTGRWPQRQSEPIQSNYGRGSHNRADRAGLGIMEVFSQDQPVERVFGQHNPSPPTTLYSDHKRQAPTGSYDNLQEHPTYEYGLPAMNSPLPHNAPFPTPSGENMQYSPQGSYTHHLNEAQNSGPARDHSSPEQNFVSHHTEPARDGNHPSGGGLPHEVPMPKVNSQQSLPDTPSPVLSTSSRRKPPPSVVKNEPPARLPVATAIAWRTKKKNKKRGETVELPGAWLFDRLRQRDHIFIIDDTLSMSTHWNDMICVFDILAYIVKEADDDGIDLFFTMSSEKFHNKHASPLVEIVRKRKPMGSCEISFRLDAILENYKARLYNQKGLRDSGSIFAPKKDVRPLNLYIFTDGAWQQGSDAAPAIQKLVGVIKELGLPQKQVGIQFISFGDNKTNLERLKHLDDELGLDYDIVDTTPSNGNVWKMLLGAIDATFDEADNTTEAVSTPTPTSTPTPVSRPSILPNRGRR